jgi:hypothetical protein
MNIIRITFDSSTARDMKTVHAIRHTNNDFTYCTKYTTGKYAVTAVSDLTKVTCKVCIKSINQAKTN